MKDESVYSSLGLLTDSNNNNTFLSGTSDSGLFESTNYFESKPDLKNSKQKEESSILKHQVMITKK